eukprot:scaffold398_cov177-Ochromonas_danica.AAC.3
MMDWEYDLIIVGGGITGLKIARDFSQKNKTLSSSSSTSSTSFLRVLVIESASCLGGHIPALDTNPTLTTTTATTATTTATTASTTAATTGSVSIQPKPAAAVTPTTTNTTTNTNTNTNTPSATTATATTSTTRRSGLPAAVRPNLYSHTFSKIFPTRHHLLIQEVQRYHLSLSSIDINHNLYIQSAAAISPPPTAAAAAAASVFRVGLGEVLPWRDYWSTIQHQHQHQRVYQQAIHRINYDACRIDLSKGIYQEGRLDSLDISWSDYLHDHVIMTEEEEEEEEEDPLVLEFFLFLPFILLGGYSEEVSALMVLHLIASIRMGGTVADRGVGVEGAIAFLTSYDILAGGGGGGGGGSSSSGGGGMIDLISALAQDCYQSNHVDFLMDSTVIDITYHQQPPPPPAANSTTPHYDYPPDLRPLSQATVRLANGRSIRGRCVVLTVPLNALLSIGFCSGSGRGSGGGSDRGSGGSGGGSDRGSSGSGSGSSSRGSGSSGSGGGSGSASSGSGWPDVWQRAAMRCNQSRQYMEVYVNSCLISKKIKHLYSLNMENSIQEAEIISRQVIQEEEEDDSNGNDRRRRRKKMTLVRVAGRRHDLLVNDLSSVLKMVYPSIESSQSTNDCWYRDDIGNPRLRSSRFLVKPGTTRLLHEASLECLSLWQRTWSVYWASSELSPIWPGWVEGCLQAGQTAVDLLTPHLLPSPIPRNFARLAISTTTTHK